MRKIFILILSFWFQFSVLLADEIVKSIEITGNKRISNQTIEIYGDVKLNSQINESKIDQILKNLYDTNFFENVQVKFSNNILKITLEEFPIVNQLLFVGEPSNKIKDQLKKNISLKEKRSFIRSNLSQDLEIIKKLYSSLGYNFSKVEAKIKEVDKSNFDLIFEINRGQQTKISSISFTGDKKIREKRLRDIIASEENKFWKILSRNTKFSQNLINLDLRLLQNYYKGLGYYDVTINSNSAELNKFGNIDLIYSIDAGTRYTINKITTNVDPTFDNKIFFDLEKNYKKFIGDYYSPFKVKKLLEEIDNIIEKNSLQFVEHNVEEAIDNESINIKFNIFEGEKVLVERVNIIGNRVTNEDVIRGEIILDEGDPFTKLGLDKSIANIKSRNIFSNVTSKVTNGSDSTLKIIEIAVEERPTGEISAGAGIGTNGGSFAFNITENNWLGEGKRVGIEFETDEESLTGQLNYIDPNYNFLGNELGYSLYSVSNDKPDQGYENTLIGAGINTKFEQYKNLYTNLGLSISYDDLRTIDSASTALKKQSGNFSEFAGKYGFQYDTRNRSFMPSSGYIVGFNQIFPVYADKKSISNTLSASLYKSFSEDVVIANKFFFSSIDGLEGDDARLSKRKYLSNRRLRGFQKNKVGPKDGNDHIGGNYASAMNFEMNLPNLLPDATKIDVGLFLDFGNVWSVDYDNSLGDSSKIRSATGIIANWSSPIGPVSFTLSNALAKAETDITESFNFNLGTTF
jgi:outer membrane protein insertion porin family